MIKPIKIDSYGKTSNIFFSCINCNKTGQLHLVKENKFDLVIDADFDVKDQILRGLDLSNLPCPFCRTRLEF